jgi:hypothetical protein
VPQRKVDFVSILRTLVEQGAEFIVVGGVAGVLNGAPLITCDLDVVHSRAADNVDRLLSALAAPDRSHLSSAGHQLLITPCGPLDLLGAIGKGRGYEELLPRTTLVQIAPGLAVRVLDLETLIEVKEETGGEKDKIVLPILRATLAERRRT